MSDISVADRVFMAEAVALARRGWTTTTPNPRVGCVLVREGAIIGRGWHERAGEPHAEIHALMDAVRAQGGDPDSVQARREVCGGATCYVTLEPCSHTGKTGPCAEALVDAGIARVVYGMEDPNPQVAGRGFELLRAAGIAVAGPVAETEALALNPGFVKRMRSGRPRVTCKLAMSLDGRTAMASGESKWITGRRAREDVQRLRAGSCAIISGIDTVLRDGAALTVRREDWPEAPAGEIRQPLRVVLDSRLRLPTDAPLFGQASSVLLVHGDAEPVTTYPDFVELLALPGADGRIDLPALLSQLGERGCNEVLVEAGAALAGSFLRRGLLDEIVIYLSPKLLGSEARPLFELPIHKMSGQLPLKIHDIRAVGDDFRITAVPDMDS